MLCSGPSTQLWCRSCHQDMLYLGPSCEHCAHPLPRPGYCGSCITAPPYYTRCRSLYLYHYPCKEIIKRYKYAGQAGYASSFAGYFKDYIFNKNKNLPDVILAVPLHWTQQILRGFNQSSAFARCLAQQLGVPFLPDAIVRTRNTPSQTKLNDKERRKNIKNAFSLTTKLNYKHVALVDDVITTGATANEIAHLLKKESIKIVELWVIARPYTLLS